MNDTIAQAIQGTQFSQGHTAMNNTLQICNGNCISWCEELKVQAFHQTFGYYILGLLATLMILIGFIWYAYENDQMDKHRGMILTLAIASLAYGVVMLLVFKGYLI